MSVELVRPNNFLLGSYLEALLEKDGGELKKSSFQQKIAAYNNDVAEYFAENKKGEDYILARNGELVMRVPEDTLWLANDKEYLGTIHLRHCLNDSLKLYGGHVGYDIRPSARRNGYGTKMLKLSFPYLIEIGLDKVLITCDITNIGSRKIIESAGGILEKVIKLDFRDVETCHYWVPVTNA